MQSLDDVLIRVATSDDLKAVLTYFNANFDAVRSDKMMEWKFRRNIERQMPLGVAAVIPDGTVVGFYGVVPWELVMGSTVIAVAQPCEVGVLEAYRGTGLYQRLYDFYSQQLPLFGGLAFGFPNEKALGIGVQKMGYKIQVRTEVYRRDFMKTLEYQPTLNIQETTLIPDSWFPYLTDKTAALGITTHRTKEFMQWRFDPASNKDFRFVTAGSEPLGVLIYRNDQQHVMIYDLMADTPEIAKELVSHLIVKSVGKSVTYGVTENGPYSDMLVNELGFSCVKRGTLVTSVLTDGGEVRPNQLHEALRASDVWCCTVTDTDH